MHHLLSLLCRLYCFLLAPSAAHYINGGPSLPPPLTPEQEKAVEGKLLATGGYRKMEMHFSVDTAIIGGMIIRIGDRVVDSSIRTKLDDLTKQLLKIQLG